MVNMEKQTKKKKKRFIKLFFYSFISGFLFFLSWPTNSFIFTPLIFIAFVPLFLIQREVKINNSSSLYVLLFSYVAFLIFNFSTTFWVEKASPAFGEGVFAVCCNAFFMSLVFYLFHFFQKKTRFISPLFFLSFFWIGLELLHVNWDLNWPWLTLGNVFSEHPNWIQWYSYTGVFGGSLWVLGVNYLIFKTYLNFPYENVLKLKENLFVLCAIFSPIIFSGIIYFSFNYSGDNVNVLVAQTNIDPNSKFNNQSWKYEKEMFYQLTNQVNDNIDYILFPETYLSTQFTIINDDPIQYNRNQIAHITRMLEKYKKLNIILGATIDQFSDYSNLKKYNSALQINSDTIQYYHKSKLVPGAEQLPFKSVLKYFLKGNFLQLAGGAGNLSIQDSISVFTFNDNKVAALICYESVFPNHVRKFIKEGAQAIFIITNDGWWGDSQGRKQHNSYACIRAIETRRYVVRSANTGISSVINPLGKFEHSLNFNTMDSFIHSIKLLSFKTFYVKHGNFLIFIYLVAILIFGVIRKNKNKAYGII